MRQHGDEAIQSPSPASPLSRLYEEAERDCLVTAVSAVPRNDGEGWATGCCRQRNVSLRGTGGSIEVLEELFVLSFLVRHQGAADGLLDLLSRRIAVSGVAFEDR